MKAEMTLQEWKERWDEYYATHDQYEIMDDVDLPFGTEDEITLTDNLCRHCKKPIKPYDYIYEVLPPYMPYTLYRKQHVYLCERCHQDFLSFRSQVIEMAKKYETMKIESFLGLKQDE